MLQRWQASQPWKHQIETPTLLKKSFQDHAFYVVETKTRKEIIIGHPASIRLGLIQVLCKNIAKSIAVIETKNSFQDHKLSIDGKTTCRKWRSKSESFRETNVRYDTPQHTGISHDSDMLTPFKTPKRSELKRSQSLTSFKTLTDRVKRLNSRYMVPVNEVSLVISDPDRVKLVAPVKEQPSTGPPPKGSRFNPIYLKPGSTSIENTKDLQALYPNSFDCIGDMSSEYNIKTDLTVLPVQHGRCKVPIEYKAEIKKELAEMVWPGYHHQTDWTNTMGQLIDLPKEGKWQAKNLFRFQRPK